ncbi:MAG: SWIM zinc finger family protein [Gammaproteobacteria bacterium]
MAGFGGYYGGWAPYVSVAERRKQAAKKVAALQKKGKKISPVQIEGRTIARTFWGKAWCDNLEAYSDFDNRLPRGRSYVRNGSVIDLQIAKGEIVAMVSGSSIYTVKIAIRALEKPRWKTLIGHCSGQIDSLVELLQGKFSRGVMEIITCKECGLFPAPKQISMACSCPDGAVMCKHVAAVLYGVGARLDQRPELFFQLRNVDHSELITAAGTATAVARATKPDKVLKSADLSGIFGIDVDTDSTVDNATSKTATPKKKSAKKRPAVKKSKAKKRATRRG